MKTIRLGMIGLGTVGGGTAAMLDKNRGFINKTANANIVMEKILVKDITKDRPGISPDMKKLLTARMLPPTLVYTIPIMSG